MLMNGLERDPAQGGKGIGKPWYKSWWVISIGAILFLLLMPIALPTLATAAIWLKTPWRTSRKILATGGVVLAMATLPLLSAPPSDKPATNGDRSLRDAGKPQSLESSTDKSGDSVEKPSSDDRKSQAQAGPQAQKSPGSSAGASAQSAPSSQSAPAPQPRSEIATFPARVTKVVDGDTVYVAFSGKSEKVRFIGVNTPETKDPRKPVEPYGKEAAAYTTAELSGKEVYLELDVQERDKYGRLLAYIWLERPSSRSEAEVRAKMFNARLLLDGYAQVMTVPPNVKYADLFVQFQRKARSANKGLWALPPYSSSSSIQGDAQAQGSTANYAQSPQGTESYYVASAKSDVFHRPDCPSAKQIKPSNLITFATREEAASGRRPCKRCNP